MSYLDDFIRQIAGKSEDEIMELLDNENLEREPAEDELEIAPQDDTDIAPQDDSELAPQGGYEKDPQGGKDRYPQGGKDKYPQGGKDKYPQGGKGKDPHDGKGKDPHDGKGKDPHDDKERASCKKWFAKVFTYCRNDQLEGLINDFLDKINEDYRLKDFSFKPEETVFLGCTCPGGRKQTILYFTFTRERNPKHYDHR